MLKAIVLTLFCPVPQNLDQSWRLPGVDNIYEYLEVLKWNISIQVDKVFVYKQLSKLGRFSIFIQSSSIDIKLSFSVSDTSKGNFKTGSFHKL